MVDNILVMVRVNSTLEKWVMNVTISRFLLSILIIFNDFLKYFIARKKYSLKMAYNHFSMTLTKPETEASGRTIITSFSTYIDNVIDAKLPSIF